MGREQRETKSASGELGYLIRSVTDGWNAPLEEAISQPHMRAYAFAGSFPWMYYNLRLTLDDDSIWSSYFNAFPVTVDLMSTTVTLLVQIVLGAFFAWLIGYQKKRCCSPTRFFLEGLLLPGLAAALLDSGSILRSLGGSP